MRIQIPTTIIAILLVLTLAIPFARAVESNTVSVQEFYPKENHYIFVCTADGFTPNGYDWDFGDGEKLFDQTENNVYHIFANDGDYTVTCTASDGNVTTMNTLDVTVDAPARATVIVDPNYPQGADYSFICQTEGMTADTYDWEIRNTNTDESVYLQYDTTNSAIFHSFTENGNYMVACSATDGDTTIIDTFALSVTDATGTEGACGGDQVMVNVADDDTTVIVPAGACNDVYIQVPETVDETRIDLTQLLVSDTDEVYATLPVSITFDVETGEGRVLVQIPAGMTMYSSNSWDGILRLPALTPAPDGVDGVTSTISIGAAQPVWFDKGVRIEFDNRAGQRIAYVHGSDTTEIESLCSEDSQAAADALVPQGDCKIDVSVHLVVWTKHFTEFVTYTDEEEQSNHGSGKSMHPSLQAWLDREEEPVAEAPAQEQAVTEPEPAETVPAPVQEEPVAEPVETDDRRDARESSDAVVNSLLTTGQPPGPPLWLKASTALVLVGALVAGFFVQR
jgi:PKD repeat protein